MYLEVSRIITVLASIFISFGLYTQAIKIWRTKSAKDFTLIIVLALIFNEAAWLNYGLALWEWPIILLGSVNIPAAIAAGIGYFKYR
jgi:MtN3 and saliva related transmembrane protein